jgi:hypothetical protein
MPDFPAALEHTAGGVGAGYPGEYLLRLCLPATLLTLARGAGLLVISFLLRDPVKTLLFSAVYALLVPVLTQSDRGSFPYCFYGAGPFPLWLDGVVALSSLGVLALAFSLLVLYFRRLSF